MISSSKIAKLANLNLPENLVSKFGQQLESILNLVSQLKETNTDNVLPTSQVTGLKNIWREDVIDTSRMLTQDEALANAKLKKGGFFCVDRQIIG